MSRRGATLGVAVALAIGLGVGGSQLPVPFVALGPGPVFNTLGTAEDGTPLIQVPPDRDHPTSGHLDLTTVNVYADLTLREALYRWFDSRYAVVPREVIYPRDRSPQETEEETRKEMAESQQHAVTAALCELGTPVTSRLTIGAVTENGPAEKAGLRKGDVLVSMDGQVTDSLCTLRRVSGTHKPGDVLRVGYRRGTREAVVSVRTRDDLTRPDGSPLLGVTLEEKDAHPPFAVTIALNDVGGPSAGLMFALGIIDRLTPGDLTGGVHIAGTGSIDDDGNVGPIGGIQQKLVAARDKGARWFITPEGNADEARAAIPDGLRLAVVRTLAEALRAVQAIAAGREPASASDPT